MKLADLSLAKKVSNSKVDFLSHMKYYIGLVVALLISAIFVVSFCGIRADFDLTGGTVLTVVADGVQDNKDLENETVNKIDKILKANNLSVSSYQVEGTALGDAVVVKILNNNEDVNNALRTALNTEFGYDSEDIIQKNYVSTSVVEETAIYAIKMAAVALSVVIVVLALVAIFRYNLSIAINYLVSVLFDIIITLAMVIICRIQINVSIASALIAVFAISSITKLLFFKQIVQNSKDENLKELTRRQHANLALRETFSPLVLIASIATIAFVLVSGLGALQVRGFGLPALIGTIFSSLTTFYFTPFLWEKIKIKDFRRKTKKD